MLCLNCVLQFTRTSNLFITFFSIHAMRVLIFYFFEKGRRFFLSFCQVIQNYTDVCLASNFTLISHCCNVILNFIHHSLGIKITNSALPKYLLKERINNRKMIRLCLLSFAKTIKILCYCI